jgi:hypothetical protein
MSSSSMLDQSKFWEIVKYLVQMDSTETFDEICENLSITKRQLNSFINFLKEVDYHLEYSSVQGAQKLSPPESKPTIKMEFTLLEWLQFQAHFPTFSKDEGKPFHEDVRNKLASMENQYADHDIFQPLGLLEKLTEQSKPRVLEDGEVLPVNEVAAFIEESILDEKCVNVQIENRTMTIYPRKIVFLDGELAIVAEGLHDKCLLNLAIKDIKTIHEDESEWKPIFSKLEVDDFIVGLRLISGSEVRLVLKVFSYEKFDSAIKHQFLGNPCMITNPQGEIIWAASIEPSNEIFEWLQELGTDVEIMDPMSFKKEFLKYCETKLKKIA